MLLITQQYSGLVSVPLWVLGFEYNLRSLFKGKVRKIDETISNVLGMSDPLIDNGVYPGLWGCHIFKRESSG